MPNSVIIFNWYFLRENPFLILFHVLSLLKMSEKNTTSEKASWFAPLGAPLDNDANEERMVMSTTATETNPMFDPTSIYKFSDRYIKILFPYIFRLPLENKSFFVINSRGI